jgi:hypothetical protein
MTIRTILISSTMMVISTIAFAQSGAPDEQTACRSDVRRFCHKLTEADGTNAFLQCLQAHRDQLKSPCRAVLESHGV